MHEKLIAYNQKTASRQNSVHAIKTIRQIYVTALSRTTALIQNLHAEKSVWNQKSLHTIKYRAKSKVTSCMTSQPQKTSLHTIKYRAKSLVTTCMTNHSKKPHFMWSYTAQNQKSPPELRTNLQQPHCMQSNTAQNLKSLPAWQNNLKKLTSSNLVRFKLTAYNQKTASNQTQSIEFKLIACNQEASKNKNDWIKI